MPREEANKWFEEVLPAMADLLFRFPSMLEAHYKNADSVTCVAARDGLQTGLYLLKSQEGGIVLLSQRNYFRDWGEMVKFYMDNVDYDFASITEKVYMLKFLPDNNLSDELTTHEFNHLLGIDSDIFNYDVNMKESCKGTKNEEEPSDMEKTTETIRRKIHWCAPIR
ncbi:poly(ADP-ribose) glycohydrolase 1-like protein isoform X1 [Tanacetum coccineum]